MPDSVQDWEHFDFSAVSKRINKLAGDIVEKEIAAGKYNKYPGINEQLLASISHLTVMFVGVLDEYHNSLKAYLDERLK
ncbi:MAG: hypothetical protein ACOX8W_06600 [bacterium]|jgi:hypothetical protein